MGYNQRVVLDQVNKTEILLSELKRHPNYKTPIPIKGETKTQFILRSVSHLISPPQENGESCEIECVDLSKAVLCMELELEKIWNKNNK